MRSKMGWRHNLYPQSRTKVSYVCRELRVNSLFIKVTRNGYHIITFMCIVDVALNTGVNLGNVTDVVKT